MAPIPVVEIVQVPAVRIQVSRTCRTRFALLNVASRDLLHIRRQRSPSSSSGGREHFANAGLEAEEESSKKSARKDWERETAAEQLARRTKYLELANDKDAKTVSLQQQAKVMAEPVIEVEDFLLYVCTFNLTGVNPQQQQVYNRNIAKVKAAIKTMQQSLEVLHVANRHGWEIAKRLIERRQTGDNKELQLAIDDVRKRDADKAKQDRRVRDRKRSRLSYRSRSPKYRRSRSRSRSPSRDYRSYRDCFPLRRDKRGRSRDKDRGRCYNCGKTGHYIQDCPKK